MDRPLSLVLESQTCNTIPGNNMTCCGSFAQNPWLIEIVKFYILFYLINVFRGSIEGYCVCAVSSQLTQQSLQISGAAFLRTKQMEQQGLLHMTSLHTGRKASICPDSGQVLFSAQSPLELVMTGRWETTLVPPDSYSHIISFPFQCLVMKTKTVCNCFCQGQAEAPSCVVLLTSTLMMAIHSCKNPREAVEKQSQALPLPHPYAGSSEQPRGLAELEPTPWVQSVVLRFSKQSVWRESYTFREIVYVFLFLFFEDRVCLSSTYYIDQAGLRCLPTKPKKHKGGDLRVLFEWDKRGVSWMPSELKLHIYLPTLTPTSVLTVSLRTHCRAWLLVGHFHMYCTLLKTLRSVIVNFPKENILSVPSCRAL